MASPNIRHNPDAVAPPTGNLYAHAVETTVNSRQLFVAGQVGVRLDGTLPGSLEEQTEQVLENLKAILASAGMGFEDVVKINAYCLKPEDIITYAKIRNQYFAGNPPATTAVVVAGLALPEWLIEVDLTAAKPI